MLAGGGGQIGDIVGVVDTDNDPRAPLWQSGEAVDFHQIADLIGHQHIPDTAAHEHFGFRGFLAADPNRTTDSFLQFRDID